MKLNYIFCLNLIWIFVYFKLINFAYFYISYFIFFGLGIGLGFHRVVCHQVKIHPWVSTFIVFIGSMTHVGSIKGSLIWHTQHHLYADSKDDIYKNFFTALTPKLLKLKIDRKLFHEKISKYYLNSAFNFIDTYFYGFFTLFYLIAILFFGFQTVCIYFLAPAALALVSHSYGSVVVHKFGYKNFKLDDNSRNSIALWLLFFGENWHNNHHRNPSNPNFSYKWWEIDLIFLFLRSINILFKNAK